MLYPNTPSSRRPELLVDDHAFRLYDPGSGSFVGIPGPLGRDRVVYALPTVRTLHARWTEDTRRVT